MYEVDGSFDPDSIVMNIEDLVFKDELPSENLLDPAYYLVQVWGSVGLMLDGHVTDVALQAINLLDESRSNDILRPTYKQWSEILRAGLAGIFVLEDEQERMKILHYCFDERDYVMMLPSGARLTTRLAASDGWFLVRWVSPLLERK